jgi:hypothetical protein
MQLNLVPSFTLTFSAPSILPPLVDLSTVFLSGMTLLVIELPFVFTENHMLFPVFNKQFAKCFVIPATLSK